MQFYPLMVTGIDRTTRDSVAVTLTPPDDDAARFAYRHGQYLTLRRYFGSDEVRRSYSICASVGDARLRVGIKAVNGGAFSTWANAQMALGDTIEAMPPAGRFTFPIDNGARQTYLAVAAGSGITPVLSIVKTVLEDQPGARVVLLYANSNVAGIMFREEIEDLKNAYMSRLSVHHVFSLGGDIELLSGRIDADKCARLFDTLIDVSRIDLACICGPEELMHTVAAGLQQRGMDRARIVYELFGGEQTGRVARSGGVAASAQAGQCTVDLVIDGAKHQFRMDGGDKSLLDAALDAGISAPYSCKAGVCSTCRAKVHAGDYEFVTNHALEDYEVERGYVLSCQCFPRGESLTVDYDV